MKIGELIKLWLVCRDVPMQKLAKDIGVSKSTISRLCNGEAVDSKTLLSLIQYFFKEQPGGG